MLGKAVPIREVARAAYGGLSPFWITRLTTELVALVRRTQYALAPHAASARRKQCWNHAGVTLEDGDDPLPGPQHPELGLYAGHRRGFNVPMLESEEKGFCECC